MTVPSANLPPDLAFGFSRIKLHKHVSSEDTQATLPGTCRPHPTHPPAPAEHSSFLQLCLQDEYACLWGRVLGIKEMPCTHKNVLP